MSERIIVTATSIMAPRSFWERELTDGILRLPRNIDEVTAPLHAAKMLHRIAGHAGFRGAFLIADDPPADPEDADELRASKRSRAASRRRWAEASK